MEHPHESHEEQVATELDETFGPFSTCLAWLLAGLLTAASAGILFVVARLMQAAQT